MKENKKGFLIFTSVSLFFLGTGVLFYPVLSNYSEMRLHENIIQGYEEAVTITKKEKVEAEWQKAEEYNQKKRDDYENILNLDGNGVMGYIEIPKIDVRLPIFHGSDEESLEKGVGHIEKTSFPIGGKGTHCVLTGHRGLPSAQLFTRLDELNEKDLFFICVLDKILTYEVDQITVVVPEEVKQIENDPEQDYITLVTCTPYGVNTHRLLVRGKRTETVTNASDAEKEETVWHQNYKFIVAGLLSGVLILLVSGEIYLWKRRRRKRRKRKKG